MPEDLWPMFTGRPSRTLFPGDRNLLAGKSVLITGAGGFLGSALAEEIARSNVGCLTLLDQSEAGLAELQVRLKADNGERNIHTALGDVRDESFVTELLEAMRVEVVFHAAACKTCTAVGAQSLHSDLRERARNAPADPRMRTVASARVRPRFDG